MLFVQELAPLELVQGREQRSIPVPDALDEVERELTPDHGRDAHGALVSGVESVDSCGQNVLRGCRARAGKAAVGGLLSCGSSEFFEEEGISLAPTDDLLGGVACVAEDCCDDLFSGVLRE